VAAAAVLIKEVPLAAVAPSADLVEGSVCRHCGILDELKLTCSLGPSGGGFARDALPLPTKPPFTAHLGNLSFDATEGDIGDFFGDCQVTNVRIVEDKLEMKPKGFGYVEFGSLDGLKKALELSGTQFQGRNIRVSVAEPRMSKSPWHRLHY
jgi:hypothetical protein